MHTKKRLTLALLAALGLTCTGAIATTNSIPADPGTLQRVDISRPPFGLQAEPVARRGGTLPEDGNPMCDDLAGDNTPCVLGRRGGTLPEDGNPMCDDLAGDNTPCVLGRRGGTLPEDGNPMCDDPAGDNTPCVIGRRGGTLPEDDGGCDDNGIDGVCV